MNAYTTEFLVRDRIAELYVAAGRDPHRVHVPESPPPGRRPIARFVARARTFVQAGRPSRPIPAQAAD